MSCHICAEDFEGRTKPVCVSCAQAELYAPRLQCVFESLEKEKAYTHGEAIVRPGNDGVLAALAEDADYDTIASGVQKLGVGRKRGEIEASQQRITTITEQAADLRRQMEDYRDRIASRKEQQEQRRKDVTAEKGALSERQRSAGETNSIGMRNVTKNLDKIRRRTIEARACLCREATLLSGLEKRKHMSRDGKIEDEYAIGGNTIPDLRKLNSVRCDTVSASLDNVCRLLCLCSHYLSVRLPAEIMLSHNDLSHPVVLPAEKSYRPGDILSYAAASGQTPSPSASSNLDQHVQPRPRPLYLDRSLPKLAKEDAKAYGLFIEGVMLLAWNVAWLCKSQGLESINTFDDVSAVGRNLYQLLLGSANPATVTRPRLDRNISTATNVTPRNAAFNAIQPGARLGAFSHASTYRSLSSAEGAAFMHGWRLNSSQRLVDKLRMYLRADMSGAEWEVLQEGEWDEDHEDKEAVFVGGARRSLDPAMSMMTVAHDDRLGDALHPSPQSGNKGATGWTRLRGRGGEP